MLKANPSLCSKHQKQNRNPVGDLDLRHCDKIFPSVQFSFLLLSHHYLLNAKLECVSTTTLWEYLEVH